MSDTVIEAAAWTMLHFFWQGALIGSVYGLVLMFVRKRPQVRYLAGCLAMLVMLGAVAMTFDSRYAGLSRISPIVEDSVEEALTVTHAPLDFSKCLPCHMMPGVDGNPIATWSPGAGCPSGTSGLISAGDIEGEVSSIAFVKEESGIEKSEPQSWIFDWMVGIWILGVALLSLRFCISLGFAQRLRSRMNVNAPLPLVQGLKRIANQIGVNRSVSLSISAAATVPSVIGWLRPVILLPVASVAGLSRPQLEAVLAHELAHVRRHDYLVNLLQHGIETLLFFHPVVWWVSRKVREEREFCCDDIAARVAGNTIDYARALATLEEQRAGLMTLEVAASGGSLQARIRRLCGVENPRPLSAAAFPALLFLLAAVIPFAMAHSQEAIEPKAGEERLEERALTSDDAEQGLRHLLKKTPEPNIMFSDVVMLARALDKDSIIVLLDEIGLQRRDGYWAWARSAIYAELASRDLDAALDHYRRNYGGYLGVREHIPHAIYVGSRPEDPWAALVYLRSIPEDPRFRLTGRESGINGPMVYTNANWYQESYRRLFKKLAAIDPERAWKELPGQADGVEKPVDHNQLANAYYPYRDMLDGFFSGLKDDKTFQHYFERLGLVRGPYTDMIAIPIVKAWMNFDMTAALAWAPPERTPTLEHGSIMAHGVDGNAVTSWARENPKAALEAIRANTVPKWKFGMAGSLLRGDPSLASEVVALIGNERPMSQAARPIPWKGSDGRVIPGIKLPIPVPAKEEKPPFVFHTLKGAMNSNASLQEWDSFPEPGRNNRPLDYRARYDAFRKAIANELFSKEEQAQLRAHLDDAFRKVLNLPSPKTHQE